MHTHFMCTFKYNTRKCNARLVCDKFSIKKQILKLSDNNKKKRTVRFKIL